MDTLSQGSEAGTVKAKKRRRTIKEKRDIVEETLVSGASVARVARKHDVNANQVFYWRKLFREGRLGISMNPQLLPVKVEAERATEAMKNYDRSLSSGTMEIEFPKGTLRIAGSVDMVTLRAVLESLAR
ncbi:MAG: transposase [Candidatus Acidiferrum sp.]